LGRLEPRRLLLQWPAGDRDAHADADGNIGPSDLDVVLDGDERPDPDLDADAHPDADR
jgi:hypothetical protein